MSRILIVDGNNLAFKCYAAFKQGNNVGLTNSVGIPTTITYGFLRSLAAFANRITVNKTVITWDVGGGNAYRRSLFPLYKRNRTYTDLGDFFEEANMCRDFLNQMGICQAPLHGIEADDIIGWLTWKFSKMGHSSVIFSDDKDYYQLLSKKVKIYRPCKEEVYTLDQFREEYGSCDGIKPKHLALIQGLCGQEKDFIPGACGIDEDNMKLVKFRFGEAKAKTLLVNSGFSLKKAKALLKKNSPLNTVHTEQLLKNWKQVKLSVKLARIRRKDSQFSKEDLEKLSNVREACFADAKVKRATVARTMQDLEFTTIPIFEILESLGIRFTGKGKGKCVKIKTTKNRSRNAKRKKKKQLKL